MTASYLFDKGALCEELAQRNGFRKDLVETGAFTLLAYLRITKYGGPLVVYIEGDGSAWESRRQLSEDPTPRDPIMIELAAADPSKNVVYLARPGQYTMEGASSCSPSYWSNERFSETVVSAMSRAVDNMKREYGAKEISLVGYSGGGAIAVLVASRRSDVINIRTVAGNLDHEAVNNYHKTSRLEGSLNPIDFAAAIAKVPQHHFAGSSDKVVPPFIAQSFVKRSGYAGGDRVTIVEGATHSKGWSERWPELLAIPVN